MNPEQRAQAFADFKAHVKRPLTFPLVGKENRPVYDSDGRLVSISEHAPLFVACVNLVHEIAKHEGNFGDDTAGANDFYEFRKRALSIMEQKP